MSYVQGSLSGKKVLLLHSAGGCGLVWHKVARELVQLGYYVEMPDLLGHGSSARVDTYSIKTLASDLVDRLVSPAEQYDILVGASFGAIVLLELISLAHFSRVTRIVLCDPVLDLDMKQYPPDRVRGMAQARETLMTEDELLLVNPSWERNDAVIKRLAGLNFDPQVVLDLFEDARTGLCAHSLLERTKSIEEVIIIAAATVKGGVYGRKHKDLLAKNYPWVKLLEAEEAAHDMHRENHKLVSSAIDRGRLPTGS